jgi:hypothetical protein
LRPVGAVQLGGGLDRFAERHSFDPGDHGSRAQTASVVVL